ncbi:MAG: DNA primase, partial [Pseudomonadales bacterium]
MAGLIPQQFIDDVLDRVDIVEVIDRRVSLKKSGRNYSACCPFHEEKTPSFSVNPDKQFFYCFGCGAGGNSISFIMDYENVDFPAAVESLAAMVGLEVPREESGGNSDLQRQHKSQAQSLYDVLAWTAHHFQIQLRQHSNKTQAIDYLKNRGLSGEVARDFGIGYAPPGWDNLLQAIDNNDDKARQQKIAQLETCGMLVKKENGDFYDRFRERIIFPIRDNRGRVIAFGGRVLNDDKPKYLNSPETPVFYKQRELYGLYEARK